MPEHFPGDDISPIEPRSSREPLPPDEVFGITANMEDEPEIARPRWTVGATLPVIGFLLVLALPGLFSQHGPDEPPVNVPALLAVQTLFYGMLLGYIFMVVRLRHGLPLLDGLQWRHGEPARRVNFLVGGLFLAVGVQLLQFLFPIQAELPIERLFHNRQAALLLAGFGIVIAPFVEEVIFRGFIFPAVENQWGLSAAVWSTAALFALIHVPQLRGGVPQMVVIFVVGLVLSWARGRYRSLLPPYLLHLGYNTALFAMLYASTRGFRHFE